MIDDLDETLLSLEGVFDGVELIDELSHALQCAELAMQAGCERDFVAAALFHDVSRSPIMFADEQSLAHETLSAKWLKPRFGVRVSWLAGAHVAAKLYLLATEPEYTNCLSAESRMSADAQLHLDGSILPWEEFSEHRWWADAVQLRRFDDEAKELNAEVDDPQRYLALIRPILID